MNGRVSDPVIARFLSADPIIQDPYHSQAFNRYSYVWNNPLNATDPTGFVQCTGSRIDRDGCIDDFGNIAAIDTERLARKGIAVVEVGQAEGNVVLAFVRSDAQNNSAQADRVSSPHSEPESASLQGHYEDDPLAANAAQKEVVAALVAAGIVDRTYRGKNAADRAARDWGLVAAPIGARYHLELSAGMYQSDGGVRIGQTFASPHICTKTSKCDTGIDFNDFPTLRGGHAYALVHTHPYENRPLVSNVPISYQIGRNGVGLPTISFKGWDSYVRDDIRIALQPTAHTVYAMDASLRLWKFDYDEWKSKISAMKPGTYDLRNEQIEIK